MFILALYYYLIYVQIKIQKMSSLNLLSSCLQVNVFLQILMMVFNKDSLIYIVLYELIESHNSWLLCSPFLVEEVEDFEKPIIKDFNQYSLRIESFFLLHNCQDRSIKKTFLQRLDQHLGDIQTSDCKEVPSFLICAIVIHPLYY